VIRYEGRGVRPGGRIALVTNDAIGNFVVVTPLLQMLRSQLAPLAIDYYGGTRTLEFQQASDLFEWSYPLHHSPEEESLRVIHGRKPYDLVVNVETSDFAKRMTEALCSEGTYVCGPCSQKGVDLPHPPDASGRLLDDKEWISESVTQRHPILKSPFIGEIFCRAAYLDGPLPPYRVPSAAPDRELPDMLIAMSASLPEKLWPVGKWKWVLEQLTNRGASVGLLGAKPSSQMEHWKGASDEQTLVDLGLVTDLRGALTLPQVVGALGRVRAVFTLDNGILHLATAAGTPTVGLFRHGIHRLWAPPYLNLTVLTPGGGNQVSDIEEKTVLEAIQNVL
jgi:heptosyltransferase III